MKRSRMDRATLEGVELEYEVRGSGEWIVLIHAGVFADWFKPLLEETALTEHYRALSYHRVGYAGSSRLPGPVSIAQQASHCRSLMRRLDIERAHVVGHSSGGNIALQLALDSPDAVFSRPVGAGVTGGAERTTGGRRCHRVVHRSRSSYAALRRRGQGRRLGRLYARGQWPRLPFHIGAISPRRRLRAGRGRRGYVLRPGTTRGATMVIHARGRESRHPAGPRRHRSEKYRGLIDFWQATGTFGRLAAECRGVRTA